MVSYFARFTADRRAGGFVATFPGFGIGATQGETIEEALEMAQDLLKSLVQDAIDRGLPLPQTARRRSRNDHQVSLSALQSAKAELYTAFRNTGLSRGALARRIGASKTAIDRLFDLDHVSTLDQIENAFHALGKKLDLVVSSAA